MKKALKIISGIAIYCMTLSAFAIDQAAVEDMTPPSAEGPLTTDQIRPSLSPLPPTTTPGTEPQTMLPLPAKPSPTTTPATTLQATPNSPNTPPNQTLMPQR